jgi:hypothetical protein
MTATRPATGQNGNGKYLRPDEWIEKAKKSEQFVAAGLIEYAGFLNELDSIDFSADDFYHPTPANQPPIPPPLPKLIYDEALVQRAAGRKLTQVAMFERLDRDGRLDELGLDLAALVEADNFDYSQSDCLHHAKNVMEYAARRREALAHMAGFQAAMDETTPIETTAPRKRLKEAMGDGVPPLPDAARLSADEVFEGAGAGRWLDDYVHFASEASPLTPTNFHEAAGLFAVSLAIARRVYFPVSVKTNYIYPNLYILFVGNSTRPRKSTALNVLRGLLRAAGLSHFLLDDRQTPEALMQDLTANIPPSYEGWGQDIKGEWLQARAIAGQRGWLLDEASHLLDSFNRDYSSGLLPLILDLYDSTEDGPRRNTKSGGREKIWAPYINIFGATTHAALNAHTARREHWHNGLFARFALINDDGSGQWQFWPMPRNYPPALVQKLRSIATELLPMPAAHITDYTTSDGKQKRVVDVNPPITDLATHAEIETGAWEKWEHYSRAVSWEMVNPGGPVPPDLHASYGRLSTMAGKVAIILAAMDATTKPIRIYPAHMYRAIEICEKWRANLHQLVQRGNEAEISTTRARILEILAAAGGQWVRRRELMRAYSSKTRWDALADEVRDLIESGEIEARAAKGKGPATEEYRLLVL